MMILIGMILVPWMEMRRNLKLLHLLKPRVPETTLLLAYYLAPFIDRIGFKQDEKQNVWWAIYDKLVVKELKTLLQG